MQRHSNSMPSWLPLLATIIVNAGMIAHHHGRLTQRVDDLSAQVAELKADVKKVCNSLNIPDSRPAERQAKR